MFFDIFNHSVRYIDGYSHIGHLPFLFQHSLSIKKKIGAHVSSVSILITLSICLVQVRERLLPCLQNTGSVPPFPLSFDFSMKRIFILVLLDFFLYFFNNHIAFPQSGRPGSVYRNYARIAKGNNRGAVHGKNS